jgi:arabinofuranosyltransferase
MRAGRGCEGLVDTLFGYEAQRAAAASSEALETGLMTAAVSNDIHNAVETKVPWLQRPRNLVAVALVALLVILAWQHRWTFDDGFINFRIVKHLEAGHGPVFNSGERVEAYTSPLWLFALALADLVAPIRIEWLSTFLGIALTAAGLALAIAASRQLWSRLDDAFEMPIGALAIVATAPVWYFATSGLEGGLTFAWLGGSLWILACWAAGSRTMSRGGWVVIGLGWLVRPELVIFSLAAAVAVIATEGSHRSLLRRIAATGWAWTLPLAYEVFRMGYFATLFPNTAYAKQATGVRWGKGWLYFTQFVGNYWLWVAAVFLVVAGYLPLLASFTRRDKRPLGIVVAWLAAAFLCTLYIIRLGGDYIDARLLLPSFFAFCAPVAVTRVTSTSRALASAALAIWALITAAFLHPATPYETSFNNPRKNVVTLSDALKGPLGSVRSNLIHAGFTFNGQAISAARNPDLPPRTAALSGIGILGYALGTDAYVFDLGGLADPVAAHFELPSRGLPGHEKFDPPPWSEARLLAPGTYAAPSLFNDSGVAIRPLILPTTGRAFKLQVDQARAALQCGDLRKLQQSFQGHLGLGRFMTNIIHSFSYAGITVPPDPAEAEEKFCGST